MKAVADSVLQAKSNHVIHSCVFAAVLCQDNAQFVTCVAPCQPTCSDQDASICRASNPVEGIVGACVEGELSNLWIRLGDGLAR